MNSFVLSPQLGWIAGSILAGLMLLLAFMCVILHSRRKNESDETLWSAIRRASICVFLAIMILTPSAIISTTSRAVNATDVVFAVDVTGSMAVKDAQYGSTDHITRIQAAQKAISDVTQSYANSSFAAIQFGSKARLEVPLTPDTIAIENWAQSLSVESTSQSAGSSLDTPINQLLTTLKSIRDEHPHDSIVLYLISDGEQTSTKTRRTYSSLRYYLNDAFTIGVGSSQGGNIPIVTDNDGSDTSDSTNQSEQWIIDPSTKQPGVSRMNSKNLQDIADEMGGSCILVNNTTTLANSVSAKISKEWKLSQTPQSRERLSPVVWPFAIATTVLLTFELGAWLRTSRRLL